MTISWLDMYQTFFSHKFLPDYEMKAAWLFCCDRDRLQCERVLVFPGFPSWHSQKSSSRSRGQQSSLLNCSHGKCQPVVASSSSWGICSEHWISNCTVTNPCQQRLKQQPLGRRVRKSHAVELFTAHPSCIRSCAVDEQKMNLWNH